MHEPRNTQKSAEIGHEVSDLNVTLVYAGIAMSFALVIFSFIVCYWFFGMLRKQPSSGSQRPFIAQSAAPERPAGPGVQANPVADMTALRTAQEKQLHSYGYINKEMKTVHIPIERAMELIIERGFETVKRQQATATDRAAGRL